MDDDRRREDRIEITTDCELNVLAPSWASTDKPLPGRMQNLTLNGIRILLPAVSSIQYETWKNQVEKEGRFRVAVNLNSARGRRFEGTVVWIDFEASDGARGTCAVGILLDVLNEEERDALSNALRKQEAPPPE